MAVFLLSFSSFDGTASPERKRQVVCPYASEGDGHTCIESQTINQHECEIVLYIVSWQAPTYWPAFQSIFKLWRDNLSHSFGGKNRLFCWQIFFSKLRNRYDAIRVSVTVCVGCRKFLFPQLF